MTTVRLPVQAPPEHRKRFFTVLVGFVLLFILLDRMVSLLAGYDPTTIFLVASSVLVATTLGINMMLFGHTLPSAWRSLGFGRPNARTLCVTVLIGTLLMGYFPIFSWVTEASFTLPDHWPWVLTGLFILHGIAEEVLFRGFAFHSLRAGRTFGRAALLSMLLFAVAHLYLFTYMPVALAVFATVLSLASAYPLAYLFERGNNTIWAPAVLHTQVHAISFFVASEAFLTIAAIAWMLIWALSVLLIYLFRERLFGHLTAAQNLQLDARTGTPRE
jgi:membrane protease YdiL (CAAX protease family)